MILYEKTGQKKCKVKFFYTKSCFIEKLDFENGMINDVSLFFVNFE